MTVVLCMVQVFPLLMQQFSSKEQGSLVWQFICSVPLMLIGEFLPWMISFLSPKEQVDVTHCIKEIVPREKSLQEVVISWLGNNNQLSSGTYTRIGEGVQCPDGSKMLFGENWNWIKEYCIQTNVGHNPIDCLNLWHGAIRKDLKEILEELCQIRSSSSFSNLDSIVLRLNFLADVLSFYSNALKKFFYPVLNQLANGCLSPSDEQCSNGSHIEGLQLLLHHNAQNGMPLCKFLDKLCGELESFMLGVSKQFSFQETEVMPIISKNCSHEMQQRLLYMSLNIMPLGLLKCVITWFSAQLSEDESRSILHSIKQGNSFVNKSFESLLCKWFQMGYSGKTSVEKFREDLQNIFKSKCSFLAEQMKEASGSLSFDLSKQLPEGFSPMPTEPISANKDKKCSTSSSSHHTAEKYETSYSSGINLHIFFPGGIELMHPFPKFPGDKSCSSSFINEPKPMDLIFLFHKALKKDLEYLVFGSAQLAENVGLLVDFRRRFHLIRYLFQIHSDAEDEVAFPALEARGKVQNISHSYTIDHKLEVEHFGRISLILDKMYELHVSLSSVDSKIQDQKMVKHHQLCRKLYDMCRSMHKLLSNHIHREEVELWPLFRERFSIEEQDKIIGRMLGRTRAEVLQDVIPWLMESLTAEEQHIMMYFWRNAAKNTMFDEWLGEWWEGYDTEKMSKESSISPSLTADPIEIISTYLSKEVLNEEKGRTLSEKSSDFPQKDHVDANIEPFRNCNVDDKEKVLNKDHNKCSKRTELFGDNDKKRHNEVAGVTDQNDKMGQLFQVPKNSEHCERLLTMSQDGLEAAIRRVSRDSSLDLQKQSYIIQNLLMSRWIVRQQISHSVSSNGEDIPGQNPSYIDPLKLILGCKHYKRNCKLFAACCHHLYTCRRCHDEVTDHSMDRKSITKMMCMKCLKIQPIGLTCYTVSCNNFSMARYYCNICKIFDDER
jgi:zinc finger-like protein